MVVVFVFCSLLFAGDAVRCGCSLRVVVGVVCCLLVIAAWCGALLVACCLTVLRFVVLVA